MTPDLVLPRDFSDYAWEVEAKGWFAGALLSFAGELHEVTFYDPVRLAQDVKEDMKHDAQTTLVRVIVIEKVTVENMRRAASHLTSEFFS